MEAASAARPAPGSRSACSCLSRGQPCLRRMRRTNTRSRARMSSRKAQSTGALARTVSVSSRVMSRCVSSPSTLTARSTISRASQTAIDTQEAVSVAIAPADADGDAANGNQVALSVATVITVTVTSGDGSRVKSYRIRVEEPPCPTGLATGRPSGVTFTGGSVNDLARRAPEQGVFAPSYWTGQSWLLLAPDAPEFLSRQFRDSLINGVPVRVPVIAATAVHNRTDNLSSSGKVNSKVLDSVQFGGPMGTRDQTEPRTSELAGVLGLRDEQWQFGRKSVRDACCSTWWERFHWATRDARARRTWARGPLHGHRPGRSSARSAT